MVDPRGTAGFLGAVVFTIRAKTPGAPLTFSPAGWERWPVGVRGAVQGPGRFESCVERSPRVERSPLRTHRGLALRSYTLWGSGVSASPVPSVREDMRCRVGGVLALAYGRGLRLMWRKRRSPPQPSWASPPAFGGRRLTTPRTQPSRRCSGRGLSGVGVDARSRPPAAERSGGLVSLSADQSSAIQGRGGGRLPSGRASRTRPGRTGRWAADCSPSSPQPFPTGRCLLRRHCHRHR